MELYIFISLLVVASFYIFKRTTYHLHMFQLNSYRLERYMRFIKSNRNKIWSPLNMVFIILIVLISAAYTIIKDFQTPILLVFWGGLIALRVYPLYFTKVKTKKPLVYTVRVKRIVGVVIALNIVAIVCMSFNSTSVLWITLLMLSTPVVILTANLILKPFESYLKKYYYNDAKRLLEEHKELKVIGVTGSYGKTSTKFILETILSQQFTTLVTPHSYNTTLGVILTVRNHLNRSTEVFVAEMGAKQKNDIKEICDLVNPDYGVVTAVGPQHLETFGSLSNIIDTKFELMQAVEKSGKGFVNGDSLNVREGMKRFDKVNYISYGANDDNKVRIQDVKQSIHGSEFSIVSDKGKHTYQTKLLGMHNILNIAGAVGVAMELGMSHDKIAIGVKELKAVEHRLELKRQGDYYILDDAFNSNPTGARFALDVLNQFDSGKKIIMTPGMIELGDMDAEVHFEFGKQIAKVCDQVILIGENKTRHIVKGLKEADYNMENVAILKTVYDGFAHIRNIIGKGDVVLIENDLPDNFNE